MGSFVKCRQISSKNQYFRHKDGFSSFCQFFSQNEIIWSLKITNEAVSSHTLVNNRLELYMYAQYTLWTANFHCNANLLQALHS